MPSSRITVDPDNAALKERMAEVEKLRAEGKPTLPTTIAQEKATNPFLRADDPALMKAVGMAGAEAGGGLRGDPHAQGHSSDRTTLSADDDHPPARARSRIRRADISARRSAMRPARTAAPRSTAIYFLLKAGERSHWHRVDAAEVWHFHAGAPLLLRIASDGASRYETIRLGPDLARASGRRPSCRPAPGSRRRSLGEWTLVGCTVAPGFRFEGFELAPTGWEPAAASIGATPQTLLKTSARLTGAILSSRPLPGSTLTFRNCLLGQRVAAEIGDRAVHLRAVEEDQRLDVEEEHQDHDAREAGIGGAVIGDIA